LISFFLKKLVFTPDMPKSFTMMIKKKMGVLLTIPQSFKIVIGAANETRLQETPGAIKD
jgi:hypothetical protein